MKRFSPTALLAAFIFTSSFALAQDASPGGASRPRTVTAVAQTPKQPASTLPQVQPTTPQIVAPRTAPAATSETRPDFTNLTTFLAPAAIHSRIAEAERLLKSRPLTTALTSPSIEFVTIAALDRLTSKTHLITLSKQTFLTKDAELTLPTSLGTPVTIRVLRANGVNTALSLVTADGNSLTPLVVEFPIEKGGLFREMAYYTSAHPALLSN